MLHFLAKIIEKKTVHYVKMSAFELHTHPAAQKIAVFDVDSARLFFPRDVIQEKVFRKYGQNSSIHIAGLVLIRQRCQMFYLLERIMLFRDHTTFPFRTERTT